MRIYLDSNVLISYLRNEIDGAFNLRFKDSEDFLIISKTLNAEIVLSELFFLEIEKIISLTKSQVLNIFKNLKIKIILTNTAKKEKIIKIIKNCKIHFSYAMHVANALNQNCDLIITWNAKDFKKTQKLIKFMTPKEFKEVN